MISEVRSQRAEVSTNSYIYGLDLSGTLPGLPRLGVGAAGVGGLLCSSRTQGDSDSLVFHAYDSSGNVCALFQVSGSILHACLFARRPRRGRPCPCPHCLTHDPPHAP